MFILCTRNINFQARKTYEKKSFIHIKSRSLLLSLRLYYIIIMQYFIKGKINIYDFISVTYVHTIPIVFFKELFANKKKHYVKYIQNCRY